MNLQYIRAGDTVTIYDVVGENMRRFIKTDKVLSVSARIIKTATARYSRTYGYILPKSPNSPYFICKTESQ